MSRRPPASRPRPCGGRLVPFALLLAACEDAATPSPTPSDAPPADGADATRPGSAGGEAVPGDAGPARPDADLRGEVPRTFIEGDPPAHTRASSHTVALTASVAFSHFECALDEAPLAPCAPRHALSNLTEGPHVFRAVAITPWGVRDPVGDSITFTVDRTPPDVVLSAPVPARLDAAQVTVAFALDEPGSLFCAQDGAGRRPCTSPVVLDGLDEGFHGLVVTATDRAANEDPTPLEVRFEVDRTAPETRITAAPSPVHRATVAEIAFTSPDADAAAFRCAVDGAVFAPCTSPLRLDGLTEGLHAVQVTAVDSLGHEDATPATAAFEVRVRPPEGEIRTGPPARTVETTARFTFGPDDARFRCALNAPADAAPESACASPHVVEALPEGRHALTLVAHDGAGHEDATPAVHAWLIDHTPPEVVVLAAPPALSSAATVVVEFVAEDAPDPAPVEVLCALDGAAPEPCVSPFELEGPTEGDHVLALTARDDLGNTMPAPVRIDFHIDRTPPRTLLWETPPPRTREGTARLEFETEPGAEVECSVDGAPFEACRGPLTLRGLEDGPHLVLLRARDAAGNLEDPPVAVEFTVDSTPPRVQWRSTPPALTLEATARFDFDTEPPEPDVFYACRLDAGAFAPCTPPVVLDGLDEGPHVFEVQAADALGNAEPAPARIEFTVDARAPDGPFAPEAFAGDGVVFVRWPGRGAAAHRWHLERRAEGDANPTTVAVVDAPDVEADLSVRDAERLDGVALEYTLRIEDAHGRTGTPGPAVRVRPSGTGRSVALPDLPPGLGTAALVADGRVVLGLDVPDAPPPWAFTLDAETGAVAPAPAEAPLVGAAFAQLPDGRLFAVGGLGPLFEPEDAPPVRDGSEAARIWDPVAGAFVAVAPLPGGPRAYPLALVVPGGYVAVAAGVSPVSDDLPAWRVDLYDPLFDAWAPPFPAPRETMFPGLWGAVATDGSLLMFGPDGGLRADPIRLEYALLPPPDGPGPGVAYALDAAGVVRRVGGGVPPTAATGRFDPTTSAWEAGPALETPRSGAALVTLPTGGLLVLGGTDAPADAELLTPDGAVRAVGPLNHAHAVAAWALLLPSGEVLVGSAEGGLERFRPWYTEAWVGSRPQVTEAPVYIEPGRSFEVTVDTRLPLDRIVAARRGAFTGGRDTDARLVSMAVAPLGDGRWQVTPPEGPERLVPGPYLLYPVDARGAPGPGHPVTAD